MKEKTVVYIHTGYWPSNSPSMTFSTMTCMGLASENEHCHFFIKRNSNKSSVEVFNSVFNLQIPANLHIHQVGPKFLVKSNFLCYNRD